MNKHYGITVISSVTGIRLFLILIMVILPAAAETRQQVEHTLNGYLQWAFEHNPEIMAARSLITTKEKNVNLATTLPDPQLSGGYFISEVETRVGPQKGKVGASQMIPWPGKLISKRNKSLHQLEAARQQLRNVEANILFKIREAYASLYATGREIAINRENLELFKQMETLLLSRYANASVQQIPVLKLQVELAVLEEKLVSLETDARKIKIKLAALLNLDGRNDEIPFPDELPRLAAFKTAEALTETAMAANPQLKMADATLKAAQVDVQLAHLQFTPDLMLMTDYILTDESSSSMVSSDENGKNPWIIGGAITIPLWAGSKVTTVQKARAAESVQEHTSASIRNMVIEKVETLQEDFSDVQRRIDLYEKTLIPKARQTFSIVQESYANGTSTILDFLDAQRVLFNLEITLAHQVAKREIVTAKIDALLGGDLTRKML